MLEEESTSDLFCGAKLGPPRALAQACDASMDFLLGPSVSIGMLTSTAKAVNGESLDFDFFRAFVGGSIMCCSSTTTVLLTEK